MLHSKLNALIARVPAEGLPEIGLIPSHLVNASPLTHETLYNDHASQPSILNSWVRIMLTMMKAEVAILMQMSFLDFADTSKRSQTMLER